jgi:cell division protein FtsB
MLPWSFSGMIVMRALRRRVHVVVAPILGIALTGYFAFHLVEGERGFRAWLRLNRDIRTATANLEEARAQRTAMELKVSNLRPEHVDPDLLDERIRATLNLVSPDDIVIMRPTAAR